VTTINNKKECIKWEQHTSHEKFAADLCGVHRIPTAAIPQPGTTHGGWDEHSVQMTWPKEFGFNGRIPRRKTDEKRFQVERLSESASLLDGCTRYFSPTARSDLKALID
jgi:hypothetical protein